MDNVFIEVLLKRKKMDGSIRKFTQEEIYDHINDQRRVPHYDIAVVAEMICNGVLEKMKSFDLIEPTDPERGMAADVMTYEYVDPPVAGQSPERILANLRKGYKREWIERKAEREAKEQTVEEFRASQSTFEDF